MSPERVLLHAELVRQAHLAERKLHQVESKVERGHHNLVPFRERLTAKLATTLDGAA